MRLSRSERGAVLVESAFVLPIVLTMVFAIVEFGLFFSTSAGVTSTTREGARYASATFATASNKAAAADAIRDEVQGRIATVTGLAAPVELLIYRADATGNPVGGLSSCTTDCYRYTWDGTAFARDGGSGWPSPDACRADGDDIDRIGVYLDAEHDLITGLFGGTANVDHKTVLRVEPLPLNQC